MGTKALYTLLVLVVCDAVERAARRSKGEETYFVL